MSDPSHRDTLQTYLLKILPRVLVLLTLDYLRPLLHGRYIESVPTSHEVRQVVVWPSGYLLQGLHTVSLFSHTHTKMAQYFTHSHVRDVATDEEYLYIIVSAKFNGYCQRWNVKTNVRCPSLKIGESTPLLSVCMEGLRMYFLSHTSVITLHTNKSRIQCVLQKNELGWHWTRIRIHDKRLFLIDPQHTKQIMCMDPQTGQSLYILSLQILHSPRGFVIHGDEVYVLDVQTQQVFCFWLPTQELLGTWTLQDEPLGMALVDQQKFLFHFKGSERLDRFY